MNASLTKHELAAMDAAKVFEDVGTMKMLAPSLFATTAHPRRSERYSFTNTYEIIRYIHEKGFKVTSVMGGNSTYNRVMVRMRSRLYQRDTRAPELVVLDSHDGSSRLKLVLGFIEFVCLNGCIAGNHFYNRSYAHRAPDLMEQILLDLEDVGEHITRMNERIDRYTVYRTTMAERMQLADAAIQARWGDKADQSFHADMRPQMLAVRRKEDDHDSLYKVMNVVQENVLRGGMSYVRNQNVQSVRSISDVRRNMNINQALWDKADQILLAA
jgi:hypothetical protein